jgi:hypothetical protein
MSEAGAVRKYRSRTEAAALVAEYEASGLRREAFCRARNVAVGTLDKYRRRVHKSQDSTSGGPIVPVEVVWTSGRSGTKTAGVDSVLVVEARSGHRIEVRRGFDERTLEQVLKILDRV